MLININNLLNYVEINGNSGEVPNHSKAAIFIHGAQHDLRVWNAQIKALGSTDWDLCSIDLPGHGKSEGAPLNLISSYADYVKCILEKLGYQQVVLIGHSMGSLIALDIAKFSNTSPSFQICGIALLGCSYPMSVSQDLLALAKTNTRQAITAINKWSHSGTLDETTSSSSSEVAELNLKIMMENIEQHGELGLYNDLSSCNQYESGMEAAARIPFDVLFLHGEKDKMTPLNQSFNYSKKFQRVRFVEIKGAGHSLMSERTGVVNNALNVFISENLKPSK